VLQFFHNADLAGERARPRSVGVVSAGRFSVPKGLAVVDHLDGEPVLVTGRARHGFHDSCEGPFTELSANVVVGVKSFSGRASSGVAINKACISTTELRLSRVRQQYSSIHAR